VVYGSATGSICYDQGLHEHSSLMQKSLKNQGKRPFRPKFSSPAARLKRKVGSLRSPNGTPPSTSTPVTSQEAVDTPGSTNIWSRMVGRTRYGFKAQVRLWSWRPRVAAARPSRRSGRLVSAKPSRRMAETTFYWRHINCTPSLIHRMVGTDL